MSTLLNSLETSLKALLGDSLQATTVVAWSGGLDSTVLLDLCRRLGRGTALEVAAIHVDHGLGPESASRAAFCRRKAARWQIPIAVESIAAAEAGTLMEAQLRMQRYAALADAAERLRADVVLTAHQANDAVETALLRFVRGTGTSGFADLAPRRAVTPADAAGPVASWPTLSVVRPLLSHEREALESYARSRGLDWRTDPANASPDQTRNRLRHQVVPALEREADSLAPMLRTLDNLADDADALATHVDDLLDRARRPDPSAESVALATTALAGAPDAEVAAALRRIGAELPSPPRWTRERLETSLGAVRTVDRGEIDRRDLSLGGARLTVEPDQTTIAGTRERGGRDLDDRRARPLPIAVDRAGETYWFDHCLTWQIRESSDPTDIPTSSTTAWFDADDLPDRLVLRGPTTGEDLQPFGLDGDRAVADILRDGSIAGSRRWRWPCLVRPSDDPQGDLLWVAGLRQARTAAISEKTSRVLEINVAVRSAQRRK